MAIVPVAESPWGDSALVSVLIELKTVALSATMVEVDVSVTTTAVSGKVVIVSNRNVLSKTITASGLMPVQTG
jgi:hypothetical protein